LIIFYKANPIKFNKYFFQNLIKNSTSLEEIRRLEKSLQTGNIEKDYLNQNQKEDFVYNQDL